MTGKEPSEIIVRGYSERFTKAVRHLLRIEGGYVNDPVDRGGATKYGISLRFLVSEGRFDEDADGIADFDLDMDGDIDGADIRKLTLGDSIYLYHRCFWQRLGAESFPRPIGEALFDQAVNGGLHAARRLLQQAINAVHQRHRPGRALLEVDGRIGPRTREAFDAMIANYGTSEMLEAFRTAVKARYHAIAARNPDQNRFLRGWLNRADQLGNV